MVTIAMKLTLIILLFLFSGAVGAQTSIFTAEKIGPSVTQAIGITDAVFSPDGNLVALQGASRFVVLPSHDLISSLSEVRFHHEFKGTVIGFLPSGAVIYSNSQGIHSYAPPGSKSEKLFSPDSAGSLIKEFERDIKKGVVVSNTLIISGDGSYDWGGKKGNIIRYDLARRKVKRAARIPMFWYASVSPSRRYVLYEHGAEDNNNTDLYDIRSDKNSWIADHFSFKKNLPGFGISNEAPVAWMQDRDSFLAQVWSNEDESEVTTEPKEWLVLFDVANRRIVWKTPLDKSFFPTDFHQVDPTVGLFTNEDGIFELSLTDGRVRRHPKLKGDSISVSSDGKRIASIDHGQVFISAPDGEGRIELCDLPDKWAPQKAYKAMGQRPPLWSADDRFLILFGENRLLFVQTKVD